MADNETILRTIREYKRESESSRRTRDALNKRNWDAYLSRQDWGHKTRTQSKQFSPRTSMGVEAVTSFIKKALTGFGDYFDIELENQDLLTNYEARELLKFHLDSLETDFITKLTDAIKIGLLSSIMIFKVRSETKDGQFNLLIDIDKPEYYYPDPTGRGLYEIHEIVKDLHEVEGLAEQGIYDKAEVAKLVAGYVDSEKQYQEERQRNQDPVSGTFRKQVTLHEVWGTIVDSLGKVIKKNVVCTVANEKWIIRKPEANPKHHKMSPFVATPIIRVPGSVWHKALYDDAVKLNLFINELQNLIMDGGAASAQNIKILKDDVLKEPSQASGGIPPGTTLLVKEDTPVNEKVMDVLQTGDVPQDALNVLTVVSKDFDMASMFNEIKAGLLPPRQVKATEVIEKEQASSQQLDSFARTIERAVAKVFKLSWGEILQFRKGFATLDNIIGPKAALTLSQMTPEERIEKFAARTNFKVSGISSIISKGKNFQKLMVAVDTIFKNPILAETFAKRFSPDKIIDQVLQGLDINPKDIELQQGEDGVNPETLQQLFGGEKTGQGAAANTRNPFPSERFPAGKEAGI